MKVVIVGLGRFGSSLARQLHEAGVEVMALDRSAARVAALRDHSTVAVELDATDEDELRAQGVAEVDVAVVAIGSNFEGAVILTDLLGKLGIKRIIARSTSAERGHILKLVGAHATVSPEEEAARETSRGILRPALADYLRLTSKLSVAELVIPGRFAGQTLAELDVRKRFGVQVLAIKVANDSDDVRVVEEPRPDRALVEGDTLVILGKDERLARFLAAAEE